MSGIFRHEAAFALSTVSRNAAACRARHSREASGMCRASHIPVAHRSFRDSADASWQVWDVRPTLAERSTVVRLSATLRDGWLAFESDRDRRRLTPVPLGWDTMSDAELRALLRRSERVRPQRRELG